MTPHTPPATPTRRTGSTGPAPGYAGGNRSEPEPLVSVSGLRIRVSGVSLVDGLSFDLHPGQILALVGPSGSGKTTSAAALLGEYPAGSAVDGQVTVAGKPVSGQHPVAPGLIAYVPQHPGAALAPALRTGPVLVEIARRHMTAPPPRRPERETQWRTAVAAALRQAGLPDEGSLHRRFPHQLSGGQQQRLVISHALLAHARVMVADEPTTGLDAVLRRDVADRLRALADDGMAVLLLSHDLDVIRRIADDVLVLHRGRPVDRGSTAAVLGSPSAALTRALVAAADPAPPAAAVEEPTDAERRHVRPHSLPARDSDGLVVAGLSAWYTSRRRTPALTEISFNVTRGTCLAVVGRSGSGKTTLARCLVGLHPHWRGSVTLDGHHLAASAHTRDRSQLARVQYVFQDARASMDPRRSVLGQVARPAVRLRGANPQSATERAARVLAALGVDTATAARRPPALSGGELRRAALARALVADPDVLICDEVTAGLDPLARTGVLDLLDTQRRERGLALLMITHERTVAARLADHIAVVDAGRIVDHGPVGTLLTDPRHPLTAALLSDEFPIGPAETTPEPTRPTPGPVP